MFQAFVVVVREGIEAFLIVAITYAYLRKTSRFGLLSAVTWGVAGSVLVSGLLGYLLWTNDGANQPLWEGIFACITVLLVGSLITQMWKIGPELKQSMEQELSKAAAKPTSMAAYLGVVLFTIVMISREGMEMVLLLFQVRQVPHLIAGIAMGTFTAAAVALLWQQFGYLINWKRFFQITTIFLFLFIIQIAVQAFHEFSEARIFPNSDALHAATEAFSTEGIYGKWYGNITFAVCGIWLVLSTLLEKRPSRLNTPGHRQSTI